MLSPFLLCFGEIFSLVAEKECRDLRDRRLAIASFLGRATHDKLCSQFRNKTGDGVCEWVWNSTLEQGDCSPLLLVQSPMYHNIPLWRRKGLSKLLVTLDLKNPDQAPPLADGTPKDRKLRSHDGFSSLHCKYRTINFMLIMQHYSQDLPNYPQHPRRSTRKADIEISAET